MEARAGEVAGSVGYKMGGVGATGGVEATRGVRATGGVGATGAGVV